MYLTQALAPARREPFLMAKKVHKKARHSSTCSALVVNEYNAKTLLRRIFAGIVLVHYNWTGQVP